MADIRPKDFPNSFTISSATGTEVLVVDKTNWTTPKKVLLSDLLAYLNTNAGSANLSMYRQNVTSGTNTITLNFPNSVIASDIRFICNAWDNSGDPMTVKINSMAYNGISIDVPSNGVIHYIVSHFVSPASPQ